ncbi:MAG: hypothetical protein EAZ85_15570 [Bacteroidetes bacterium]|nr:MAG: hypothetical protein EAZ85_15570 [Bacteroidota bacterium]TAG88496.1 MAG: hypothetical protein EAZ20_08400 [Bacteroidota bacterium]
MNRLKIDFLLILSFLFVTCQSCFQTTQGQTNENINIIKKEKNIDTIKPNVSYWQSIQDIKKEIEQTKKNIKNKNISTEIAYQLKKNLFEKALIKQILPYWYGTKWSFSGHTEVPNQGTISCGYYVSTTLAHIGVQINRITLAQQLPIHEAMTLDVDSAMIRVAGNVACEDVIKEMKNKLENGIYFIGFGNTHVGFLIKKEDELFLTHTGSTSIVTVIDTVENIPFFCLFYNYYIVPLSNNKSFLDKWWSNSAIKTRTK